MNEITALVEMTKRLEKLLTGAVLSSWLFSLLATLVQFQQFDIGFNTLVAIFGGVVGTAAILSVYLARVKHPADLISDLLEYRPIFPGIMSMLALFISLGMFYLYYDFAMRGEEICILFFSIGTFLFFRTLVNAASIIYTNDQQKALWYSMSEEERRDWLERQRKMQELADEMNKLGDKIQAWNDEMKAKFDEEKRNRRREKIRRFFVKGQEKTYDFRKKFKLVTQAEILERDIRNLQAEEWFQEKGSYWHSQSVKNILDGNSKKLFVENTDLVVYQVGSWIYIPLSGAVNTDMAQSVLAHTKSFGRDTQGKLMNVAIVTDSSTRMTIEANNLFIDNCVEIVNIPTGLHLPSN